jgi:hypothetical protein
MARTVAKRPDVLLCDEPTGALDFQTGVRVLSVLEPTSIASRPGSTGCSPGWSRRRSGSASRPGSPERSAPCGA